MAPRSVRTFWHGSVGSAEDRFIPFGSSSVQHGTAVFEGIRGYTTPAWSALFRLDDHLARLLGSAELLGIRHEYDIDRLRAAVIGAAAATGLPDCYLRPGLFAREPLLSIDIGRLPFTLGIEVWPMPPARTPADAMADPVADPVAGSIRLTVSPWRRPAPSSFPPRVKAVGTYVTSALAKAAAVAAGFDDAVQLDPDSGRVAEATTANIVLVRDGVLRTPWLRDSLLAGITRDTVLVLARDAGIPVEEGPVEVADLLAADEVFLTGTASELTPVAALDQHDYPPRRPVYEAISAAFRTAVGSAGAGPHGWLTPVSSYAATPIADASPGRKNPTRPAESDREHSVSMTAERTLFSSGSPYESTVGYSRAVRVGPFLSISGTTASAPDGPVGGSDVHLQAMEALNRIAQALQDAGADLRDVVRTRVYLTDMAAFDAVAKAHAATFADIRPATTFVEVSALASPSLLVEIEADAIIADHL